MTETDLVNPIHPSKFPPWLWNWAAGLSIALLAGFFSWLGLTQVAHGQEIKVIRTQLTIVIRNQEKITEAQISVNTARLADLERRLDRLEKRLDQ